LFGRPVGKIPVRIPGLRKEDNIKLNFRKVWLEGVDWVHLAQGKDRWWAFLRMIMNLRL
jgi:hypothetical protein